MKAFAIVLPCNQKQNKQERKARSKEPPEGCGNSSGSPAHLAMQGRINMYMLSCTQQNSNY